MKIYNYLLPLLFVFAICSCKIKNNAEMRNEVAEHSKSDIVIGAAGGWGKAAEDANGGAFEKGIKLAVNMVNSEGGVMDGRKLKILWKDDNDETRKAKIVAEDLSKNINVSAVIGHIFSDTTLSASLIYQKNGVLLMSPLATANELTNRKGYNLIFRSIPSDAYFAEVLMEYVANNGFKYTPFIGRIVIFNVNNVYGNNLAKEYEKLADSYRIKVAARRTFEKGSSQLFFKSDIEHINKIYSFDAVLIVGNTEDAAKIIAELKRQDSKVQVFCSESVSGTLLRKILGVLSDNIFYCSTYNPDILSEKDIGRKKNSLIRIGESPDFATNNIFRENYLKAYGELPNHFSAQGYDAVWVLVNAMRSAGSSAPEKVAEALRNSNYKGVTGDISFKDNGDMKKYNVVIKKIVITKEED